MKRKEYSCGDITIVWKPEVCIHAGICTKGLAEVFRPRESPWINVDGASTDRIKAQIDLCPSGALSYTLVGEENPIKETEVKAKVIPGGPVLFVGPIEITHADGRVEVREAKTSICRCGHSGNKPFCDGSHKTSDFEK